MSAFQQDIVKFANKWAQQDYTKDSEIETTYFKKMEHAETLDIVIDSLGWARKKQPPSVSIPPPIKTELVTFYNVRPNLSTAQARVKLIALPQYTKSIFVEYVITEARFHSYFGQLKNMKTSLHLDASSTLVIHQSYMSRLGRLSKVNELRLEIYRRKLIVSQWKEQATTYCDITRE